MTETLFFFTDAKSQLEHFKSFFGTKYTVNEQKSTETETTNNMTTIQKVKKSNLKHIIRVILLTVFSFLYIVK